MALPIPRRPSGFTLGDPAANVRVDAFVDIQCEYSKAAWPTLIKLIDHYAGRPVSVTVHMIALSNHRQCWDMSLGLFAIADGDAQRFFDFASFLYARQDQFENEPFRHKTHADLVELVAGFAIEHAGVDRAAFLERMNSPEVFVDARTPIRYATARAVWGTPTFFINNADDVPVDHRSTLADWTRAIDALL